MKAWYGGVRLASVFMIFLLASAKGQQMRVSAQTGRAAVPSVAFRPSEIVRIRRLQGVGKQYLVKTPEYRTTFPSGTKRPQDWAEIKVEFDTAPEWIDEMAVQYYVLTATKDAKDKTKTLYSFYKTTARYVDVEQGSGHAGTVYLPPNAIKRYGLPVAVAVEITIGNEIVAEASEADKTLRLPANWWKDPNVLGSENVTIRSEYLLPRRQSPFAFVNIDDYEVER